MSGVSVFLKLICFCFLRYVAHAASRAEAWNYMNTVIVVLSKALDVNAKELSLLAYGG